MPFELLACLLCSSRKSRELVLPSSFFSVSYPSDLGQMLSGRVWCTPCPQVPLPGTAPLRLLPCPTPVLAAPALASAVHACDVLLVSAGSLLHPSGLHDLHPLTRFLLVPDCLSADHTQLSLMTLRSFRNQILLS